MADEDTKTEEPDVRWVEGSLTDWRDTTVGGGGIPFAGIGWSGLPPDLREIGREARMRNFPTTT